MERRHSSDPRSQRSWRRRALGPRSNQSSRVEKLQFKLQIRNCGMISRDTVTVVSHCKTATFLCNAGTHTKKGGGVPTTSFNLPRISVFSLNESPTTGNGTSRTWYGVLWTWQRELADLVHRLSTLMSAPLRITQSFMPLKAYPWFLQKKEISLVKTGSPKRCATLQMLR
jgi:hypothetical protein